MEEFSANQNNQVSFSEIFYLLRKYFFLMLAIIILVTSVGVGFSLVKQQSFTASVGVRVLVLPSAEDEHKWSDGINTTQNYIQTIIDFCDEGVVVDRANYYYHMWNDRKNTDTTATLSDFLSESRTLNYNPKENRISENYISKSNIDTVSYKNEEYTSIIFYVNYTDFTGKDAEEKAQILVTAFTHEASKKEVHNGVTTGTYFKVQVDLEGKGLVGNAKVDTSKRSIVFGFAAIGVVLSVAVVYLIYILDNGIKHKDDLERITGTQVVGIITYNGGRKNAK